MTKEKPIKIVIEKDGERKVIEINDDTGELKTKEIKKIQEAIREWARVSEKNVVFVGSFIAHDKNGGIKETLVTAFGSKTDVKLNIALIEETIKEEKEDFINI